MADLSGKVVVLTGADGGLGPGIAGGLAEAGATLYLTGAGESFEQPPAAGSIQAVARQVEALGGRAVAVRVDHRRDEELVQLFQHVRDEQGRLDVLVNHGGAPASTAGGRFWEQPPSAWDAHWDAAVRGCYVATVLAAPAMVAQGSGLIVNVCSAAGAGEAWTVAEGAASAAVERMARDMAAELAPHGVTAMALWPGLVKTAFVTEAAARGVLRADLAEAVSPRFIGRCVAALAMDPDVLEKAGGAFRVADLAAEYRFTDPEAVGQAPNSAT